MPNAAGVAEFWTFGSGAMMNALNFVAVGCIAASLASGNAVGAAAAIYDQTGEHAGTYLCLPVAAGGVAWDADVGEWSGVAFRAEQKYILSLRAIGIREFKGIPGSDRAMSYFATITEVGQSDSSSCDVDLISPSPGDIFIRWGGVFDCRLSLKEWRFNLKTHRYIAIYPVGYIGGDDNNDNTPSITVGTCTKVQ